jgi:hypothetical protein
VNQPKDAPVQESLVKEIAKLELKSGQILVVSVPSHAHPQQLKHLYDYLRAVIHPEAQVLIKPLDVELQIIDQSQAVH